MAVNKGTQYITNPKSFPKEYNNVQEMIDDPFLEVGFNVRTLGYYSKGDGGGNDYEVVAAGTGTDDGGSFIDLSGSGFQAKGLFLEGVKIKQFGAVGDGISDDQVPIDAFLSYCDSENRDPFWNSATYLSSSSIDNLHTFRHTGNGAILRNGETFYLNPKKDSLLENNVYVSAAGVSTNDGLSSSEPITSPEFVDILENYAPLNGGVWVINFADGTYTNRVVYSVKSKNPVKLMGSSWVTSPNVVFDGQDTENNIFTASFGADVYTENIKFTGCLDNVVEVRESSRWDTRDSHYTRGGLSTSSGACMYVFEKSRLYANGKCLFDDVSSSEGAITLYDSSTASIGQDGTGPSDSPSIANGVRGVQLRNQSLAKLRFAYIDSCTAAVDVREGSRLSHENGEISDCTFAYRTFQPASVLIDPDNVALTNVTSLRYAVGVPSIQDRPIQTDDVQWQRVGLFSQSDMDNSTVSGTTAQTDIVSAALSLLDQDFNAKGRAFKVVVYGNKTGVSGTLEMRLLGGSIGFIHSLTAASSKTGSFRFESEITALSQASTSIDVLRRARFEFDDHADESNSVLSSYDLSAPQDISLAATLSNASDSLDVYAVEVLQAGI